MQKINKIQKITEAFSYHLSRDAAIAKSQNDCQISKDAQDQVYGTSTKSWQEHEEFHTNKNYK